MGDNDDDNNNDVSDDDDNDNKDYKAENLFGLKICCAVVLHFVPPPCFGQMHASFEC